MRRDELAELVGEAVGDADDAIAFFALAWRWDEIRTEPASLRETFEVGHRAIAAILSWAVDRSQHAHLGQTIVKARLRRGWGQNDLAEAAGISVDTVSNVESPAYALPRKPRYPPAVERIATALQLPLIDLLTLRPDNEITNSFFAYLLPDVQRRRVEMENGPQSER
jgi:transcriptional regulator with XRE-family HTH domain